MLRPLLVLISIAASLCSPLSSYSESFTIDGLTFTVDELAVVDDTTVKVRIGENTRIVDRLSLEDYVVRETFSNEERGGEYSPEALLAFSQENLKRGNSERAERALEVLVHSRKVDPSSLLLLLSSLEKSPATVQPLKNILLREEGRSPGKNIVALLLVLEQLDPEWLRTQGSRVEVLYTDALKISGKELVLRRLNEKDLQGAFALVNSISRILGREDPDLSKFKALETRLQEVDSTDALDKLTPLIDISKRDAELEEALRPYLIDALHHEAQQVIEAGDSARALVILSRINFQRRTPTTHELVGKALATVGRTSFNGFFDRDVTLMLSELSLKDSVIRDQYIQLLATQVIASFRRGSSTKGEVLFLRLLEINPDPSQFNDGLRIQKALEYIAQEDRANAEKEIGNVKTGISLDQQWLLFTQGYYIGFTWLFIALFSPLAAAFIFFKFPRFRLIRGFKSLIGRSSPEKEEAARSESEKIFVSAQNRATINPRLKEYTTLLTKLGVSSDAKGSEIKNAYRKCVKDAHPDTNQDIQGLASERFIDLTNTYERILELRRELGYEE